MYPAAAVIGLRLRVALRVPDAERVDAVGLAVVADVLRVLLRLLLRVGVRVRVDGHDLAVDDDELLVRVGGAGPGQRLGGGLG